MANDYPELKKHFRNCQSFHTEETQTFAQSLQEHKRKGNEQTGQA